MKFVKLISLIVCSTIAAQENEKRERENVTIDISLPMSVTQMPDRIAQAGERVANSLSLTTQTLTVTANSAIHNLSEASDMLSQKIQESVTELKTSIEKSVNYVETAVNRFSNIFILKFFSLAAMLMGLNMIYNNDNFKGLFFCATGLTFMFKAHLLFGKFRMDQNHRD